MLEFDQPISPEDHTKSASEEAYFRIVLSAYDGEVASKRDTRAVKKKGKIYSMDRVARDCATIYDRLSTDQNSIT